MSTGTATKMWVLDGSMFTLDSSLLVVGSTGTVEIPVPAFLVQHPRGLVLFDTGIAPEAMRDPSGTYGELADLLNLNYTEDQLLEQQIKQAGFKTSDVTHVVISHSHFDHTGAAKLFPQAKFFIGAPDLAYAYWPMPAASAFFRTEDIDPCRGFDWNPLTGDHDLFGDGSIRILSLPGHTPGNTSSLVRLPSRSIMLAGDTVHLREALYNDLPMPSDWNTLESVHSIRRLKQVASAHDATIWIHHDPDDWREYRAGGTELD